MISFPGGRDIENPEHRKYIAGVWGVPEESIPHKGLSMVPIIEAIHAGKIKGLLAISCNPMVSLPNNAYIREAYEKLEFFAQIDFFMSETARYADVVLAGSLMEEDEGTTTNVEGRVIHHKKGRRSAGETRASTGRSSVTSPRRLGQADKFKLRTLPKKYLTSCASHQRVAFAIITASPGSALTARRRLLAVSFT